MSCQRSYLNEYLLTDANSQRLALAVMAVVQTSAVMPVVAVIEEEVMAHSNCILCLSLF